MRSLFRYIAREASDEIATRFLDAILDKCLSLAEFPERGSSRDKIRPGLRTIPFRRRVTIAYSIDPDQVTILGVFYGGQDLARALDGD